MSTLNTSHSKITLHALDANIYLHVWQPNKKKSSMSAILASEKEFLH